MKLLFCFLFLLQFLVSPIQMIYSQVTLEWSNVYTITSDDRGIAVAIDDSSNVYVTGYSRQIAAADIFTAKYNKAGTFLWSQVYNGTANNDDVGHDIVIDALGSIYVTGYSFNTATGSGDYTTIKYNSSGVQLWLRNYNGPGNGQDIATSLAVDSSGYVYITGYSSGNGTGFDIATLKYAPNGSLQWSRRYNGPANGDDVARKISVDKLGNVYVTGYSAGIGTGTRDYVTIKYTPTGDSAWVARYNGTANGTDEARCLAIDELGNVFVSGYAAQSGTGSSDYTSIKYDPYGDSIWVKKYNGLGNGTDVATSINVDAFGNAYVAGYSMGSGTGNDYLTMKYSINGDSIWVRRYNVGDDYINSMALDSIGNVYVTGGSSNDVATIKYDPNGAISWLHRYHHANSDRGEDIAVGKSRGVCVTGFGLGGNWDRISLYYSQQTMIKLLVEGLYDQNSNAMIRDSVKTYLISAVDSSLVDSAKYYLDNTGTGYFRLHNAPYGQYYIVIKHRNALETWSQAVYPFNTMSYDFTTSSGQAWGNNLILKGSKFCIYSGDVNQDEAVDATDLALVDNAAFIGVGGYVKTDVNGDFFVDGSDLLIVDNNATGFASVQRPPSVP